MDITAEKVMTVERRIHQRITIQLDFNLRISRYTLLGKTNNMSLGGARISMNESDTHILSEMDQGRFSLQYNDDFIDLECQLLRINTDYIAMHFINISAKNSLILRRIVNENSSA